MKLSSALAERTKAKNTPGVLLPAVKKNMLAKSEAVSDRRWDIIHPSELSHQKDFCPRAVYMRITEGPVKGEKFDFVRDNIFDEGHSIHAKWQERLRQATPLFGNWSCDICATWKSATVEPHHLDRPDCANPAGHLWRYQEITLDAEDSALLVGHADGGAWSTLAEIKSVGEGSVRIEAPEIFYAAEGDLKQLWRDITRPFKTHVNQVDIYLWISQQMGYPFTSAEFIYESKWNQQVKTFTIEYSEERSMKLVDQAVAIKYAVERGVEPACRFPGLDPDTGKPRCGNCVPFDERRATQVPRRRTARTTGRKT